MLNVWLVDCMFQDSQGACVVPCSILPMWCAAQDPWSVQHVWPPTPLSFCGGVTARVHALGYSGSRGWVSCGGYHECLVLVSYLTLQSF